MCTSLKKAISVLLSLAMTLTLIHVPANAKQISLLSSSSTNALNSENVPDGETVPASEGNDPVLVSSDLSSPLRSYFSDEPLEARDDTILSENYSRREPYTKHFYLSDGTSTAATYGHVIHEILPGENEYIEITNRLQLRETEDGVFVYSKEKPGTADISFRADVKDKTFSPERLISMDDMTENGTVSFSWGLLNAAMTDAPSVTYEEPIPEEGYTRLVSKADSGLVTYDGLLPDTSFIYRVLGNDLKETLIVNTPEAFIEAGKEYRFLFTSDTLHPEQKEGDNPYGRANEIELYDDSGVLVRRITAPYMHDDEGLKGPELSLVLEETEEGFVIRLIPDEAYMTSPERTYPVTIDPVISRICYQSAMSSTYLSSDYPNSNPYYQYGEMVLGYAPGYGNVMRGALKVNTLPNLREDDMVIGAYLDLYVYIYSGYDYTTVNVHRLNNNTSIQNLTFNNITSNYDPVILDSQRFGNADVSTHAVFDVTRTVKEWYLNGNNYGLAFITENESGTGRCVWFHSSTSSPNPNTQMPIFTVQYLNQSGLESYLTYHSMGTGTLGTAVVGDFNGNLIYTYNDLSMDGAYLPISISHVYNHSRRSDGSIIGSTAHYGAGFQMNVTQKIESVTGDLASTYPYRHLDADGTYHYYTLKTGSLGAVGSTYAKEYESTTILTKTSTGFTLDDGGTILYDFKTIGSAWHLSAIRDVTNGKTQTMTFIGDKITKITDGAGREALLAYDGNGYLTRITDPAGRYTWFFYTNGMLTRIVRPDLTEVHLAYANVYGSWHLVDMTDTDGYKLQASYHSESPYRVSCLTEYGTDGSLGRQLAFTYNAGETTVTDNEGHSETMMFDNAGHTVCIRDGAGNAVFGSHSNTNDDKKHALLYQSKLQGTVRNYIKNGGFEDGMTNWTVENGSAGISTTITYEGAKSAYLSAFNGTSEDTVISQSLQIPNPAGKVITLSADMILSELYYWSMDCRMGIGYRDGNGNWVRDLSDYTDATDTEWRRFSHTVVIPNDVIDPTIEVYFYEYVHNGICVWIDNVQLELDAVMNRENLLENERFYDAVNTTSPSKWTGIGLNSSTDKVVSNGHEGNGFAIRGDMNTAKGIYQSVPIKNGHAGDNFVFSSWAKADPVAKRNQYRNTDRPFAIRFRFVHADNTYEEKSFDFEAKTSNWQHLSASAVASSDYVSVEVRLVYEYQRNTVIFDDVQLYRERFGNRLTYDSEGRLTESIDPYGKSTTYTYVASGRPEIASVHYPDGTSYTYSYDSTTRRLLSTTDSTGIVTTYSYDSNGNAVGSSASSGTLTLPGGTSAYTGSYKFSETDSLGNTVTYVYNENKGTLNSVTDPENVTTTYSHNASNDRLTGVAASGSTVGYTYTGNNLTSITHNTDSSSANDVTYNLTYDVFGNRTGTKVGTVSLATYTYAANDGNLTGLTYGNGDYEEYTYDTLGRMAAKSYNGVEAYRYHYGLDGKLGVEEGRNGHASTFYKYDQKGRLSAKNDTVYRYDDLTDELTRKTTPTIWDEYFLTTEYGYSGLSGSGNGVPGTRMLDTVDYSLDDEWSNVSSFGLSYQYDSLRRRTGYEFSDSTTTLLSGQYSFQQTSLGDTTVLVNGLSVHGPTGTNWNHSETFTYDSRGNIETVSEGNVQKARYYYDDLNELVREDNAWLNKTIVYVYDKGGNIQSVKEYPLTSGSVENLTPTYTDTYTYGDSNWKDKLTAFNGNPITYDQIGNPLTYHDGTVFTWENGRQLASATRNGTTVEFEYGSDGIRTSKTVDNYTHRYILEDGLVRAETVSEGASLHYWFYYFDENGRPVGFTDDNYCTYLYLKNLQGDVIGLIDDSGALVAEYTYDSWGKTVSITGTDSYAASRNPFRYRGYYLDTETGLYYVGSRYYDPEVGRWINADGLLSTGQGTIGNNMFAYCGNNPVNGIDPTGMWNWGGFLFGLGLAVTSIVIAACVPATIPVAVPAVATGASFVTAAATDSAVVLDISFTTQINPAEYGKAGASLVIDYGNNETVSAYAHHGRGSGVSTGITLSAGVVENMDSPQDYAGDFADHNVSLGGGLSYSYNPNKPLKESTRALFFSYGGGLSFGIGHDIYLLIN